MTKSNIDKNLKPRFVRKKGEVGGAIYFVHPCCICGKKDASFGFGVNFKRNPPDLGKWYCLEDKPEK